MSYQITFIEAFAISCLTTLILFIGIWIGNILTKKNERSMGDGQ